MNNTMTRRIFRSTLLVGVVVLLALLFSLITWLNKDISSTFAILRTRLQ